MTQEHKNKISEKQKQIQKDYGAYKKPSYYVKVDGWKICSVKEAAKYIGCTVSTIYIALKKGKKLRGKITIEKIDLNS